MQAKKQYDYAIIGGGVVGLSVAHGLGRLDKRAIVIDEGDLGLKASRGNFGLIWTQSKGLDAPHYHVWSCRSAQLWADHADELTGDKPYELGLQQEGGYDIHLSDETLAAMARRHEELRDRLDGAHLFEIMGHNALRQEEPHIGPKVAGAIFSPKDGHVNPLRLLRALAERNIAQGTDLITGHRVDAVTPLEGGGYRVTSGDQNWEAAKVVLAAGLGSVTLARPLGLRAELRPQRGQVLITEKCAPLLRRPAAAIRQVNEGGIQIGSSQEEVGFDDRTTTEVAAGMAARAIAVLPALRDVRILRHWAALRVMTPDGKPVYQQSPTHPGAYLVTCHSGITLSAAHARLLPLWLEELPDAPDLEAFSEQRSALPTAA
jgi:glycine/D-amino acid oxidase-like deaminating enzyme